MTQQSYQRRNYYIKKPFQRGFIIQFCALIFVGCLFFGAAIYLYATRSVTTAFIDSRLRVMSTADFLFPALGVWTLLITALVTVIAAFRMLFLSHRIAGPLYRLEKVLKGIGEGNISGPVRLRSGDELQEVARSMDQMIVELRSRIEGIKKQNDRLRVLIATTDSQAAPRKDFFDALKDVQGKLEEQINYFRG